jgi:hypothetical protein
VKWKKADLRWQAVVRYHERIARRHALVCAPGPQGDNRATWHLRLFELDEDLHYPYAVVNTHGPTRRNGMCSVTIHRGNFKENLVRPVEGDYVYGFDNACKLAFPLLQVYDAANRLTGFMQVDIAL